MPELDGHETTKQLRQLPMFQQTAIVMVSASAFNQDRDRSLEVGCNAFISKPVNPDTLFFTVRSLLNLEWIYEDRDRDLSLSKPFSKSEENKDEAIAPPLIAPSSCILEKLMQFARMGDILAIQDEVVLLQNNDPSLLPFANQVLDYARDFQIKRIREFLEEQQSEQQSSINPNNSENTVIAVATLY
jgi:CheY-like chemotaxis protein